MAVVFVLVLFAAVTGAVFWLKRGKAPSIGAVQPTKRPTMSAGEWNFAYSPGMPAHPTQDGAGLRFEFPRLPASVHYLTFPTGSLAVSKAVAASFRVDVAAGDPAFDSMNGGQVDPGHPGAVRLYFQRRGDDMSGAGPMEFYRWWSNPIAWELRAGPGRLEVPMTPDQWSSVLGKRGDSSPESSAAFAAAAADIGNVGVTFGGQFFGHGAALSGDGVATFVMESFEVS